MNKVNWVDVLFVITIALLLIIDTAIYQKVDKELKHQRQEIIELKDAFVNLVEDTEFEIVNE